jgi:ubiquinone/menaquinone biosynthesis C-methylase UbiE
VVTTAEERQARDDRHFDRWARRYDRSMTQSVFFDPVQRSVVKAVSPLIPRSGTVLDVGCGTGRLLDRLGSALPDVRLVGLDRSRGMARAARQLRPGLAVARGTAEALPYQDSVFDVVVTTISFHHWLDKPASIAEVHRVLRPGGLFALTDVSVDDTPSWPACLWARVRHSMSDMPPLDQRERMLITAGFHVLKRVPTLHRRWITLTIAERPAR